MRILLIEDEKKTAAYLAKGLSEAGFQVTIAEDGDTGLEFALSRLFDLFIIDVMVEAEYRILFTRDEPIMEGGTFRYFYSLKLHFDRLISFPAALTLRHTIDEQSPLYGETAESLAKSRATFVASVIGIDPVIPAAVQTQQDYTWRDVRFGERFVEIYSEPVEGRLTVDFGRLHDRNRDPGLTFLPKLPVHQATVE